jgi:hypothetical protein
VRCCPPIIPPVPDCGSKRKTQEDFSELRVSHPDAKLAGPKPYFDIKLAPWDFRPTSKINQFDDSPDAVCSSADKPRVARVSSVAVLRSLDDGIELGAAGASHNNLSGGV